MFSSICIAASVLAATAVASPVQSRSGLTCTESGTSGALKIKHISGPVDFKPTENFTSFGNETDASANPYLTDSGSEEDHTNVAFQVCTGLVGFETGSTYGQLKISGTNDQCLTAEDYSQIETPLTSQKCATDATESSLLEKQWFKVSKQDDNIVVALVGNSEDQPKPFTQHDGEGHPTASRKQYNPEFYSFVIA